MIFYRVRRYGSPDWTRIQIDGPEEIEALISSCIEAMEEENMEALHMQVLGAEGEWEDVE